MTTTSPSSPEPDPARPAEPVGAPGSADATGAAAQPAAPAAVPVIRWAWLFLDTPVAGADRSWRFWSEATGWGVSDVRGGRGEFATLEPARGDSWVKLQAVGEGPGGVHLDLDVDDVHAAAARAEALGATRTGAIGDTVVILRTPGGFTFCLTAWQGEARQVRDGAVELLDQVCLDIPQAHHDSEVAFWRDLTGWRAGAGRLPGFSFLERPRHLPFRLLLQRLGGTDGAVRAHVDLACTDRVASTARHQDLGARVLREREFWTVLSDPTGRVYCLTDRDPVDPPGTAPNGE
ncbi:MAG: VOC family protein [Phycicoccus sp.]